MCPVRSVTYVSGRSLWVWALARIVAFIALECGLWLALRVSSRVSEEQKALFARLSLHQKIPFPARAETGSTTACWVVSFGGETGASAIPD
jgi:hypothetical protein